MAGLEGLAVHTRTRLFRAVVDRLRANPDLGLVIGTSWKVYNGTAGEAADFTLAQLPGIKVYLGYAASHAVTIGRSLSPMTIHVELWVAGTNQDDITNLWGAVERALFPGDGSIGKTLQDLGGLPDLRLTVPGITHTKLGDQAAISSVGSLECGYLASTRT
jgi:hypothetical protein